MLLLKPLPDAKTFISHLNLLLLNSKKQTLSPIQCAFIALVISAMALSGQLNWSWISRATLDGYGSTGLSWMFRCAKIRWEELREAAVVYLMQLYEVFEVHLVIDDTDRPRSKIIKTLFGVFKTFDKKTGGFFQAQNIVFVLVVTKVFSFPIAFAFFQPDPAVSKWQRTIKLLKKKKIYRSEWPAEPIRDHKKYPTRNEIAVILLTQVKSFFSSLRIVVQGVSRQVRVITVTADAAYFSKTLKQTVRLLFKKAQFVSQLKKTQICWNRRGSPKTIENYFSQLRAIEAIIRLRGGKEKKVFFCSARLFIRSHGELVHVVLDCAVFLH